MDTEWSRGMVERKHSKASFAHILLIVAVFGSSGSIVELICIYFFTVAISLSPLGEMCLAAFAGASDIKRVDIKLRVVPLVQYVLDKAKENTSYCPKKVKVKIIHTAVWKAEIPHLLSLDHTHRN